MIPWDWLAALGAFLAGVGTLVTAWIALQRAKKDTRSDAERECEERLRAAWRESEELHAERMGRKG